MNCKVNTIRQADKNSEPLFSEKPVQETGSEPKTRGKVCQEESIKTSANDKETEGKDKRKPGKQLTWLQKMWAEVPEGEAKDWVKGVYTQETDWGDQGEMMWKQIVKDGGLEGIKRQNSGGKDKEIIECRRSTKHLKKRHPASVETNSFFTEFEIKSKDTHHIWKTMNITC